MEMKKRTFSVAQVLSVTTGKLLCDMDKVYEILDWMMGCSLWTHELPFAGRVCARAIREQIPELRNITGESITPENWREELTKLENELMTDGIVLKPLAKTKEDYNVRRE